MWNYLKEMSVGRGTAPTSELPPTRSSLRCLQEGVSPEAQTPTSGSKEKVFSDVLRLKPRQS